MSSDTVNTVVDKVEDNVEDKINNITKGFATELLKMFSTKKEGTT